MLSSQVCYAKFISQDVQRACLSAAISAKNNFDYAPTEENPLPRNNDTQTHQGEIFVVTFLCPSQWTELCRLTGWFGWKLTVVCGDHEGVGGRVSRRSAVFEGAVRLALLELPVQTKQVHSCRRGGGK